MAVGSFQFQPGELAKLCLVIFFAAYLAERKELLAIASRRIAGIHFPDLKHFGPLLVMWGLSLAVMFFEKDLGSSLLFFSIFLVMLYMATARFVYMAVGGLLFGVGAYVGYQIFTHVQARVAVWLNVFDPNATSPTRATNWPSRCSRSRRVDCSERDWVEGGPISSPRHAPTSSSR